MNKAEQNAIWVTLRDHGPLNRKQLVELMAIPRTTLFDNLEKLRKQGSVRKFPQYIVESREKGRPVIFWEAIV